MENLTEALDQFASNLNLVFVISFILLTWVFNTTVSAKNFGKGFTFFEKIPKILRVLVLGVVLVIIFVFVGGYSSKEDIFALFLSMIASMVIWKIGVEKIFKLITEKIGIKID